MEPEMFRDMVDRVVPCIEKSQEGRPLVWQGLKLAITFRFLSIVNSYHSLAFNFRIVHNTISSSPAAVDFPRALAHFFSFSAILCSARSAYFDILMLTIYEVYGLNFSNF